MNDESHSQLTFADNMKFHAIDIFTRVKNRLYAQADAEHDSVDYEELSYHEEQLEREVDYINEMW